MFNLERLADDIKRLINENLDFIIIDYPFGYRHKQIAPYIHYSIFIDTPLDVAMARRILRDYNEKNALEIFNDMKQYLERGRNAYLFGLESVKENADFLVDGSLAIDRIVDIICEKVINVKNDNLYNKHDLEIL